MKRFVVVCLVNFVFFMSTNNMPPSSPTIYAAINADDLPRKKQPPEKPEKYVPQTLRLLSPTWKDFFMSYDTMFIPPKSPPVAKYDEPPVPNAPLSPERHHLIMPSSDDEMCACALRKRNDVSKMDDCLRYLKDMQNNTAEIVVEQKGRMFLSEQENKQSQMLYNMYTGLIKDFKCKRHFIEQEAIKAQSIVAPPLCV